MAELAQGNELLDTLREETMAAARRMGIGKRLAHLLARSLEERIRMTLGGRRSYIPKPDTEERDRQIRERFNGRNHSDICHEFGIAKTTLYRILKT